LQIETTIMRTKILNAENVQDIKEILYTLLDTRERILIANYEMSIELDNVLSRLNSLKSDFEHNG
jgi:hypothetical protein